MLNSYYKCIIKYFTADLNIYELTCVSFSGVLILARERSHIEYKPQLMYRVFAPLIYFILVIFPITIVSIEPALKPGIKAACST